MDQKKFLKFYFPLFIIFHFLFFFWVSTHIDIDRQDELDVFLSDIDSNFGSKEKSVFSCHFCCNFVSISATFFCKCSFCIILSLATILSVSQVLLDQSLLY